MFGKDSYARAPYGAALEPAAPLVTGSASFSVQSHVGPLFGSGTFGNGAFGGPIEAVVIPAGSAALSASATLTVAGYPWPADRDLRYSLGMATSELLVRSNTVTVSGTYDGSGNGNGYWEASPSAAKTYDMRTGTFAGHFDCDAGSALNLYSEGRYNTPGAPTNHQKNARPIRLGYTTPAIYPAVIGAKVTGDQSTSLGWTDLKHGSYIQGLIDDAMDPDLAYAEIIGNANMDGDPRLYFVSGTPSWAVVDGVRCYNTWDGFGVYGNGTRTAVGSVYIRNTWVLSNRDDGIENDEQRRLHLFDCLFEDAHSLLSTRASDETGTLDAGNTQTVENCVVQLVPGPGGHKRPSADSTAGYIYKMQTNSPYLVMRDTIISMEGEFNYSDGPMLPVRAGDLYENVSICWLGAGAYPGNVPTGVTVYTGATAQAMIDSAVSLWKARHGVTDFDTVNMTQMLEPADGVTGSASLGASSNMVVTAGAPVTGSADLSATGSLTADPYWPPWIPTDSPTSGGAWNQIDSGGVGEAHLSAISSLTATGTTPTFAGSAALSATANLAAAGSLTIVGSAGLSASGDLVAVGALVAYGAAALEATATLAADGTYVQLAAAALDAQSNLAAAGELVVVGSAALSAESNLEATYYFTGQALLSAQSDLTAAPVVITEGAAALSSEGVLAAAGTPIVDGAAALDAVSTLVAVGALVWDGAATLSAESGLNATGAKLITGLGLAFFATGSVLVASGIITEYGGAAELKGGSLLVAGATAEYLGAASLSAASNMAADGAKTEFADPTAMSSESNFVAAGDLARYPAAVALDDPAWWFDLGDTGTSARNKGDGLLFGYAAITGTYTGGTRVASIIPTEVTGAFDTGTTGYFQANLDDVNGNPITVEVWKKPEAMPTGSTRTLMSGANGKFALYVGGTGLPKGRLRWRVVGAATTFADTTAADDLVDNGVYHIVATYHPATGAMQLYVNSKLVATATGSLNATTLDPEGYTFGSFSNGVDGPTQQTAIYHQILSPARIAAHYVAGTGVALEWPALSAQSNLVADGYAMTEGATVGTAALSAQSSLTVSGVPQAVWVAQSYSATANLAASGSVISSAVPNNDDIVGAIELTGLTGSYNFATRGSTTEDLRGSGSMYSDPDVFFKWTAPADGPVQFRLFPRTDQEDWFWDIEMEVYDSYPPDLDNFQAFNPDVEDPRPAWADHQVWGDFAEVHFPAVAGRTYTFVIVDYSGYPDPPWQTEARIEWEMELQPVSSPAGFGYVDYLLKQPFWNDSSNEDDESGLLLSVIRQDGQSFSVVATLKLFNVDYFPSAVGLGHSTFWQHAPCGVNRVLLHATNRYVPNPVLYLNEKESSVVFTVTWDGTTLTPGAPTVLHSDIPLDTYSGGWNEDSQIGVVDWNVAAFENGICTGDGQFWLVEQIRNLNNGKTYARWKHRLASYFVDLTTGVVTPTGQSVQYTEGYDFTIPSDDLLAPIIWTDPTRRWLPGGGTYVDLQSLALGPREVLEQSTTRTSLAGSEAYLWTFLSVANDGAITRGSNFFDGIGVNDNTAPFAFDLIPGTRKVACFGQDYPWNYPGNGEVGTGFVQVLDLDTWSVGPKAWYEVQENVDWADDGGNQGWTSRVGSVEGQLVFFHVKQRPGSAYQGQFVIRPFTLNGNVVELVGDYRILRTVAWARETYDQVDIGRQTVIKDGIVFIGNEGEGVAFSENSVCGQALSWSEGEGYQTIIPPGNAGDITAVYDGELMLISDMPAPNLAGGLIGHRRAFGRGKAGV